MRMGLTKREKRRRLIIRATIGGIILLVVILIAVMGAHFLKNNKSADIKTDIPVVQEIIKTKSEIKKIESNMAFFGNVYWGRYINEWSMKSDKKYKFPFSRLSEFNRSKYDAWIAGLECPIDPNVKLTAAEEEATLSFNCNPEYLTEAAKWFTVFTLANNHTDNQGIEGFASTRIELDKVGIQYFGHYDPRFIDQLCEVVSMPARAIMDNGEAKAVKLPIALCGYHGVFRIPSDEAVAEMAKYKDIMPVIAMPHMGAEYKPAPDEIKTTLYRNMIDAGADMVIGDHPHWVQSSEAYKGKLIIYSMGNFIFDQQDYTELTRSVGVNVKMASLSDDSDLMQKWINIGEKCATFNDDCLETAKQESLSEVPYKYDIRIVSTDNQGKIAHPATEQQKDGILQRLNWANTINGLKDPYYGQ